MKRILTSRVFTTGLTLVCAALLVVGIAAYIQSRPDPSPATNTETYGRDYELPVTDDDVQGVRPAQGRADGRRRVHPRGRRARGPREGVEADAPRAARAVRLHLQAVADGRHPRAVLPLEGHLDGELRDRRDHAEGDLPPRAPAPEGHREGQAAGLRHRAQDAGHRARRSSGSSTTGPPRCTIQVPATPDGC